MLSSAETSLLVFHDTGGVPLASGRRWRATSTNGRHVQFEGVQGSRTGLICRLNHVQGRSIKRPLLVATTLCHWVLVLPEIIRRFSERAWNARSQAQLEAVLRAPSLFVSKSSLPHITDESGSSRPRLNNVLKVWTFTHTTTVCVRGIYSGSSVSHGHGPPRSGRWFRATITGYRPGFAR